MAITFRKLNIFRWGFFLKISTLSENHESELTRDIPAPWREVSAIKVVKQKKTNFIFWKIWESKFQNGTKNLQKASEMEFLDHVHVEQQSCCRECNESSKKSNQIENLWILPTFWLVCLITFMADTSLQGAGISRVSPDSCFSDNVDIFRKKSHRKIFSFRKVTAVLRKCFFCPQLCRRA